VREGNLTRTEVLTALAELFVGAGVQCAVSAEMALAGLRAVAGEAGPGPLRDFVTDTMAIFDHGGDEAR
jgi:hypothetical protein